MDVSTGVDIHSSSKSAFKSKHLWPDTMVALFHFERGGGMCLAHAAVVAANLRDNLYVQPLIKQRAYAWVTSSKVPGGCGKEPASECGLSRGGRAHFATRDALWFCPILPRFSASDTEGSRELTAHVGKREHTNVICN